MSDSPRLDILQLSLISNGELLEQNGYLWLSDASSGRIELPLSDVGQILHVLRRNLTKGAT